jgi:hypothetical protein
LLNLNAENDSNKGSVVLGDRPSSFSGIQYPSPKLSRLDFVVFWGICCGCFLFVFLRKKPVLAKDDNGNTNGNAGVGKIPDGTEKSELFATPDW